MWHCSSKPIDITGARATRGISYQAATPVDVPAVSSLALPPAASACTMNLLNLLHEFGDELTIEYYCIDTKKAPGMKVGIGIWVSYQASFQKASLTAPCCICNPLQYLEHQPISLKPGHMLHMMLQSCQRLRRFRQVRASIAALRHSVLIFVVETPTPWPLGMTRAYRAPHVPGTPYWSLLASLADSWSQERHMLESFWWRLNLFRLILASSTATWLRHILGNNSSLVDAP